MLKRFTRIVPSIKSLNKYSSTFNKHSEIMKTVQKIGTHDGVFHCDEALACFMLKQLPQYKDAEIVRSRDPAVLGDCDIVVDVGAVFNHEKKLYDHHQREFTGTLSSLRPELGDKFNIKLSSAGLIYAFYGEDVIKQVAGDSLLSKEESQIIFTKVYEGLIQEIDGIDNGIPQTQEEPMYKISTHLSNRVGRLNPEWNTNNEVDMGEIFKSAMSLVGEEFLYTVKTYVNVWLPARSFVKQAIDERFDIHKSGSIVEFTERIPWKSHLFDLELEMELGDHIKYVIFNDKPNSWRVQCVPVTPTSFVLRKPLLPAWWGLRNEELSDLSGVADCVFCHGNGFIGGNKTREGALKMAVKSLEA